jgi:hypothetical protein
MWAGTEAVCNYRFRGIPHAVLEGSYKERERKNPIEKKNRTQNQLILLIEEERMTSP